MPWRRVAGVALSPLSIGIALLVAAPWYALSERANPGYLRHFLVYEHFGRFTDTWMLENGRWQCVASHTSLVKK